MTLNLSWRSENVSRTGDGNVQRIRLGILIAFRMVYHEHEANVKAEIPAFSVVCVTDIPACHVRNMNLIVPSVYS